MTGTSGTAAPMAFGPADFARGAGISVLLFALLIGLSAAANGLWQGGEVIVLFSEVGWLAFAAQCFVLFGGAALAFAIVLGVPLYHLGQTVRGQSAVWVHVLVWAAVGLACAVITTVLLEMIGVRLVLGSGWGYLAGIYGMAAVSTTGGWWLARHWARRRARRTAPHSSLPVEVAAEPSAS